MTISINKNLCQGCKGRGEGLCERICPGGLIERKNKAEIVYPEKCWDCAACIKACPHNAIQMYLPSEIGGKGSTLSAKTNSNEIIWEYKNINGQKKKFSIQN